MRILSTLLFVVSFAEMYCHIYGWPLYMTVAGGIVLAGVDSYCCSHKDNCDDKDTTYQGAA